MLEHTFLWHDYETFGANPRSDRPAQFAAIRTDMELNEIGDPLMLHCQPCADYLPSPAACLLTGITPQHCLSHGVPEDTFARRIEAAFSQSGTIGVGYNTIRFDDEVTRFLFWRNLIDPYAREWQNGCGRWDLLDVVRMVHALRPDGIQWPHKEDGTISFRLEDLARANGLLHEHAHDALSDVRATIALARLIRQTKPRLFEFALGLHKKDRVVQEIGQAQPFLHISGMFGPQRGCLAVMWPLGPHPTNRNEIICWDLSHNPCELATLDAATARQRIFTRDTELPKGMQRLPIKTIHINKSPMVVGNLKTLDDHTARRWGIDLAQCLRHAEQARALPDLRSLWQQIYDRSTSTTGHPAADSPADVDQDLYGGFIQTADRQRLQHLRTLSPADLRLHTTTFDDPRLEELVFRWRARNWPDSLSPREQERWQAHRAATLLHGTNGTRTAQQMFEEIDTLCETADERGEDILGALYDYADSIIPETD